MFPNNPEPHTNKRRNPLIIQAAAISSFVLSRNQYVNGYMAIHMGIWHIATGSHVDAVFMKLLPDKLLRPWLKHPLKIFELRLGNPEDEKRYQVLYRFVLDNIQEFLRVWEGGIGLENRMICACACTAIGLEDCTKDAFDFVDRFLRILKNEQAGLMVEKLYQSNNWTHICGVQSLHVLHALFSFVPSLEPMEKLVSDLFQTDFAIHCMREGHKTKVTPLGCNSEKEIETAGMLCAIHNFLSQAGVSPVQASHLISWFGGDGGSVLAMDTVKKYLATMYDPEDPESDYKNLYNILLTIACAGFKCLTNFKDCGNYYPLSQSMTTIWETQILDCWRLELGLDHDEKMNPYFDALAATSRLPTFEWFCEKGEQIVDHYLTPEAYEQALSKSFNDSAPDNLKFPVGEPYSSSTLSHSQPSATDDPTMENCNADVENVDAEEDEPAIQPKSAKEKKPTLHIEEKGFTGDPNSILFKMEYSWWIEAAYAIPDGDIGRVWEIMKVYTEYSLFFRTCILILSI
ncbi:hypothetical protein BT96DRAFT_949893 [Gymnopus androsaceus JB14]|uniref:DUF6589 domain-containing protein n=1 Tax=Gymnopus androsaceus JB14 TaxID=1447944 RepID=A0A6A4GI61_9AGAR|nr:hypothetical protein BT96DRAFT_949893 [Gymnopus androsaceus JB14]